MCIHIHTNTHTLTHKYCTHLQTSCITKRGFCSFLHACNLFSPSFSRNILPLHHAFNSSLNSPSSAHLISLFISPPPLSTLSISPSLYLSLSTSARSFLLLSRALSLVCNFGAKIRGELNSEDRKSVV